MVIKRNTVNALQLETTRNIPIVEYVRIMGKTQPVRNHRASHKKVLKRTYIIWAVLDDLGEGLRK